MPYDLDVLQGDTAQVQHPRAGFGSGRMVAQNLVLTSAHVLFNESLATGPELDGWQVRLAKDRRLGAWPFRDGNKVVWHNKSIDMALILLVDPAEGCIRPGLKLRVATVSANNAHEVEARGYPRAAKQPDRPRDLIPVLGRLTAAERDLPLRFGVDSCDLPNAPHEDWPGMSGSAVLMHDWPTADLIWIYGVVQAVPVRFNGQLSVARLADAWQDRTFRDLMVKAGTEERDPEDPTDALRRMAAAASATSTYRPRNVLETGRSLPDSFVARPDVAMQLKALLLSDSGPTRVAVIGLAGSGKTTIATDLARDPDILARFSDGALWATLGQTGDHVLASLNLWIAKLGGVEKQNKEAASQALGELLVDRRLLLVIDDAWRFADVQPFLVAAPTCRIVITSRELLVAKQTNIVDPAMVTMPVLTEAQAVTLLARKLGRPDIEGPEHEQALAVADAVGRLPLALELAAVQVSDGYSWSELLDDLKAEIGRLERLAIPLADEDGDDPISRNQSLLGSFNLTLRRLSDQERARFAWLGLTAEDAVISSEAAAAFWDVDTRTARDQLTVLQYRSLLRIAARPSSGGYRYQMHDLVRALARRLFTAKPAAEDPQQFRGLGQNLVAGHRAVLGRYKLRAKHGAWHTIPDDGYILQHLIWHLEQAAEIDELHAVLWATGVDGRNGWYAARDRAAQIAGYVSDIERAWRLAETDSRSPPLKAQTQEIRYAMIEASLNGLVVNVPPSLGAALLKHGCWTPDQALSSFRRMADSHRRAAAISAACPYLCAEESSTRETLSLLQKIPGPLRIASLAALANRLPEETLDLAWQIAWEDETSRRDAALSLVRALPESLVRAAQQQITDSTSAPELRPLQVALLERLAALGFAEEAATAALELADPNCECDALRRISPYFSGSRHDELVAKLLPAAERIGNSSWRAYQLEKIMTLTADDVRTACLDRIKAIDDEWDRAAALVCVARRSPEALQPSEIAAAFDALMRVNRHVESFDASKNKIFSNYSTASISSPISAMLQAAGLDILRVEVTDFVASEKRTLTRIHPPDAVRLIAPVLPEDLLQRLLTENYVRPEKDFASVAADVLKALAPYLTQERAESILADADATGQDDKKVEVLGSLLGRLNDAGLKQMLHHVQALNSPHGKAGPLALMMGYLEGELRDAVAAALLTALEEANDPRLTTRCLENSARFLPEGSFQQALSLASRIRSDEERWRSLDALGSYLPPTLLVPALDSAQHIDDAEDRASTIVNFARLLPEWPPSVVESIRTFPIFQQAREIAVLAPHAPDSSIGELLDIIATMPGSQQPVDTLLEAGAYEDTDGRAEALSALTARCSPHMLARAFDIVRHMEPAAYFGRSPQAQGLAAVAPALTEELLAEALSLAAALPSAADRSYAIGPLAARLAQLGHGRQAVDLAAQCGALPSDAITIVIPIIDPALLTEKDAVFDPKNPRRFVANLRTPHPLTFVVPHLDDSGIAEILSRVASIDSEPYRSEIRQASARRRAELKLFQAAVETARSIEDPTICCEVLLNLASMIGPDQRLTALQHAGEAALKISETPSRIVMQIVLALTLAPDERRDAIRQTCSFLPEIDDARRRFEVVAQAARILAANGAWDEALDLAPFSDGDRDHLRLLAGMIPALPHDLLAKAAAMMESSRLEPHRQLLLSAIRLRSRQTDIENAFADIAALLQDIGAIQKDSDFEERSLRSYVVEVVFHCLASSGKPERALALAHRIPDRRLRAAALSQLRAWLEKLPEPNLLPIWRGALRVSAGRPRRDFLSDLNALWTLPARIGGVEATRATVDALATVGDWWS